MGAIPRASTTADATRFRLAPLVRRLAADGFAHATASEVRALLPGVDEAAWRSFAESWETLDTDTFMNDGGRYRRRRHAVFTLDAAGIARGPDQPHYQTLHHNPLNGGIARLFTPVADAIGHHPVTLGILEAMRVAIEAAAGFATPPAWFVEMHQFRIEAHRGMVGLPTPEGVHRDGVDYVAMMLVERRHVAGGETVLSDDDGAPVARMTLSEPSDLVLLDDHRLRHGTSPLAVAGGHATGHRDMLVLTFRRMRSDTASP